MSRALKIIEQAKGMPFFDDPDSALLDLHPELAGRMHVFSGNSDQEIPNPQTYQTKALTYSSRIWVHKAINVWAKNIAPLRIQVVRGPVGEAEPIPNHTLAPLLEMPNPRINRAEFWSQWAIEMGFAGEIGFQVVKNNNGDILELWPRQSSDIIVRTGKQGKRFREVVKYVIRDGEDRPSEFDLLPEEMLFFKFYNPLQVFRGLAFLTALRLSISIDFAAQLWSEKFFVNSARPDWALVTPEGITETEKKEILQDLWNKFRGVLKAHMPIILEKGITDIKTFSFPPKDLEWLEQRKVSRDEIGGVFGIPDEIMGFGRDTFENFDTADRVLWTGTLEPLIRFRDNNLTFFFKKVNPVLRPDERIWTDLSQVPQLQENIRPRVDMFDILTGKGVPPVTASQFLRLGIPRYQGDTVGYISATLIGANSASVPRVRSIPGQGTKAIVPEFGSDEHKATVAAREELLFPNQKKMQAGLKKYFQAQQTSVTRSLRENTGRQFGRGKHVDKQGDEIPSIENLFDVEAWVADFITRFQPIIADTFLIVGNGWWESLGLAGQFEVTQVVERSISFITDFQAREINKTTFGGLLDLIISGEQEGLGIPALQENINAFFGGRKSSFETERIARTTMVATDNLASQVAWEQSKVVKTKIWISALLTNRTRDAHATAHGQEVQLNEFFNVGFEPLFFPGDPNGSAGNIINCLCTTIPGKIEE